MDAGSLLTVKSSLFSMQASMNSRRPYSPSWTLTPIARPRRLTIKIRAAVHRCLPLPPD